MLHRNKKDKDLHKGKWNGLGGKLEDGETPEEAVIREVKEESGLIISQPEHKGILTWPLFDGVEDWIAFVFLATDYEGTPKKTCEEGSLHWIKHKDIHTLPLWEGDYFFIPWLFEDRFFSARFYYEDKKLVNHDVVFYSGQLKACSAS